MGLTEWDTDEVLLRAVIKGIILRYTYVAAVFDPSQHDTWTVWPAVEGLPPMAYDHDGIQDYCAALVEMGV